MVPDGWHRTTLEGLIEIKHGFAFKSEYFSSEGEYVLMTPGSFYESGGFRDQGEKTKYYIGDIPAGYILSKGDVLLAMTEQASGLLGSAAFVPKDNMYLHNQRLGLVSVTDDTKANVKFIYWLYNSPYIRKQVSEQASGTKVRHTSPDRLRSVVALMPPVGEQKKIAKILSTWDKAIAAVEKLIANSQQQKKALMQQLLTGKKRLPGFGGDWELIALGDIGAISSAGVDKKVVKGESEVRLLNFLDVFRREFIYNRELNHSVTAPAAKIEKCSVQKGDIFFTPSSETREDLAMAAVAAEDMDGVVYSYHVVRFRPGIDLDLKFSAYLFQTDDFRRQAYKAGDGSGQRYVISQSSFRTMTVRVPNIDEQQAIGGILYDLSKEESVQVANLKLLKEEKKALMQQLLTGKRRVLV